MLGDDNFNDPLDNLFDRSHLPKQAGELASIKADIMSRPVEDKIERIAHAALFEEACKKCGGSGTWRSFSGRSTGRCFACKGKGKFAFKTDAATRAHQRDLREQRKDRAITEAHDTFKAAHPAAHAWMVEQAPRFEFAQAMLDALTKWGALTEKQQAAVDKCVARETSRNVERQARIDAAPSVNTEKLEQAFARVQRSTNVETDNDVGTMWKLPILRLDTFHITPARKDPAILYVKEGETYCGKITAGKFHRARECTDEMEARIAAACADPDAAARQYGLRFGVCSCCGRTLTNQTSRELGIGPVCRERWFAI